MMKQKEKRPIIFYKDSRRPLSELSRLDIVQRDVIGDVIYVGGYGPDNFTAFIKHYKSCVCGPRVFYKEKLSYSLTVKDRRIYGSLGEFVPTLMSVFHLDWLASTPWAKSLIGSRKDLWTLVLHGKITNPEALAKAFSKKCFGGAYSYKTLKRYFSNPGLPSLWDLYYYTTNPELSCQRVIGGDCPSSFSDLLKYCKAFNTKLNPKWSEGRMRAEEQIFIEKWNLHEMEKLHISDKHIASPYKADNLSLILSEKSCYLEGCKMHNCVHTNYWKYIAQGKYLIARGYINGEYVNFGIILKRGHQGIPELAKDQVCLKYNGCPQAETFIMCHAWLDNHQEELLEVISEIKSNTQKDKKKENNPNAWLEEEEITL